MNVNELDVRTFYDRSAPAGQQIVHYDDAFQLEGLEQRQNKLMTYQCG